MYNTYYLKNGCCVVYEHMPWVKSVSIGIWVRSGSMYERKDENGISHFIEHMLFKGTTRRSARQIAEEIDSIGGRMNAYTSRECTCYYSKTLSESLELLIDILSDMYHNSLFSSSDIELERKVIIEEINMYEDSPEDFALDLLESKIWKNNSLGYPVAGTRSSVRSLSRKKIIDYYNRRYTPENTVISVAGCFDEKHLIYLCEKYFLKEAPNSEAPLSAPVFTSGKYRRKKDIEQSHLAIAFPAYNLSSDKLYTLSFMNSLLGGGMSSRLFQSVRENHGLCYSIYSYTGIFPNAGMLGIYAGLSHGALKSALCMIEKEIDDFCRGNITDDEVDKVRSQLKCSVIMGRESVSARMSENGRAQLLLGKIKSDDEIMDIINTVNKTDIINTANDVFRSGEKAVFILDNN